MRKRICLALLALVGVGAGAQTTINIGNTIATANVDRPGFTLGNVYNYGMMQIMRSLNYHNFGYVEAPYWQASFDATTGGTQTTTSWYNSTTNAAGYPANFWAGATFTAVSQTGVVLGAGTVTASTAQTASTGISFTLTPALSAAANNLGGNGTNTANSDMLIVRLRSSAVNKVPASANYPSSSGTLSYAADTSPASTNTAQSLQISSGGSVTNYIDNQYGFNAVSPTVQTAYININGAYSLTYKAKCTGTSGAYGYSMARLGGATFSSGTDTSGGCNTTAGSGWQTFTHAFTGAETGSQVGTIVLTFSCTSAGGACRFQDMDVIEGTALPGGNPTVFRDSVVRALAALKPGSLRLMAPQSWCSDVTHQIAPLGNRGACGISDYGSGGVANSIGYDDFLQLTYYLQTDAWITLGHFNTPADEAQMVTWLSTSGWTGKYAALGKKIYLEDGNEPWNPGAGGQQASGNGNAYGVLTGAKNVAARAATGYNVAVIQLVSAGWASRGQSYGGSGAWTNDMLTKAGCTTGNAHCPDAVDYATYTMNTLTDLTDPFTDEVATLQNWASQPCSPSTCTVDSMKAAATFLAGYGVKGVIYEGCQGISTGTATPTQAQMNGISNGVGEAMNCTQNMQLLARDTGFTGPRNEFAFVDQPFGGSGLPNGVEQTSWTMAAYLAAGPGQLGTFSDVLRANGIAMQVVNGAIGNNTNLMTWSQTGTPTFSYAGGQSGTIFPNPAISYLNSIAYGDGAGHYTLIVYNNNKAASETITLAGAGAPTGSVQKTVFGGPVNALTDSNINSLLVNHATAPVVAVPTATTLGSLTSDTLAAGSMTAYTWSNTGSTPVAATPGFSPGAGTYSSAQTVTVSDTTPSAVISVSVNGGAYAPYAGPIAVTASTTLAAYATAAGYTQSVTASAAYVIPVLPVAATPVALPAAGTYPATQTVALSTATAGAAIYYTTNGSTPTSASTHYVGPVTVTLSSTVKAIAVLSGYTNSTVSSTTYIITAPGAAVTINGNVVLTGNMTIP